MLNISGYVTSLGKSLSILCTESGTFAYPNPPPPCRAPVACDPTPIPPATTGCLNSTSTNLMEWDYAYFSCVRGSVFTNSTVPKLMNGSFPVQCGLLGQYPNPVTWGGCVISHCLTLPAPSGYLTSAVSPVSVNATINYACASAGKPNTYLLLIYNYCCFEYLLKHELLHALVIVLTTQPHKTFLRFCINFPQATLPATAAYRYQSVACRTELFRTSPGLLADQRLAAGQHLPRTSQRHSCRRQHRRGCTSSTMPLTCANLERRWSTSRLQVKRTT